MIVGQLDFLARLTDPDTSHEAARLADRQGGMRQVLAAFCRWPDEAVTDHQLAERAGMDKDTASVRRKDLCRVGLAEFAESYGMSPRGRRARRWRVTPAGIEAWRERAA